MKYSVPGVGEQFSNSNYQARSFLSQGGLVLLNVIFNKYEYDLSAWLMGPRARLLVVPQHNMLQRNIRMARPV